MSKNLATVALYNKVHLEFYMIPCKLLFELNIKILSGLGNSTLVREAARESLSLCAIDVAALWCRVC